MCLSFETPKIINLNGKLIIFVVPILLLITVLTRAQLFKALLAQQESLHLLVHIKSSALLILPEICQELLHSLFLAKTKFLCTICLKIECL